MLCFLIKGSVSLLRDNSITKTTIPSHFKMLRYGCLTDYSSSSYIKNM